MDTFPDPNPNVKPHQLPARARDLTGQRFGRWLVARFDSRRVVGKCSLIIWRCRCDCGKEKAVRADVLISGRSTSCGCWNDERRRQFTDLTGRRFGRLLVLAHDRGANKRHWWRCRCDCGTVKAICGHELVNGDTVSCGCHKRAMAVISQTTHGASRTREYRIWKGMLTRCYNPEANQYHDYGGRGIQVFEEWHDFANFLRDVGAAPSPKHTLDRFPDRDGDYKPGNVRWATPKEQANNKRNNRTVTYQGVTRTVAQWAEDRGVSSSAIINRLNRGWGDERAIGVPFRKGQNR